MTFPSIGGLGQFSKKISFLPVDVTPVSMATISPIIKDTAFLVYDINIHIVIASQILQ
jgi:hypothetical protein